MNIEDKLRLEIKNEFAQFNFNKLNLAHLIDNNLDEKYFHTPSFFPYGNGRLENGGNKIKILILGQDFGTVDYYCNPQREFSNNNSEDNSFTIKNIKKIFGEVFPRDAKNRMDEVFLSNVFIGLRISKKMTGSFIEYVKPNEEYLNTCFSFLEYQIRELKVNKILILGKEVIKFLYGRGVGQFELIKEKPFKEILKIKNIKISINGLSMQASIIPHPCIYSNISRNNKASEINNVIKECFSNSAN